MLKFVMNFPVTQNSLSCESLLSGYWFRSLVWVILWGRIEVCTGCWWKSLRERGHWGDQDVEGGRWDWMELAQVRDRWRALVGTVRDLRVP
jgi:hypothetical protein